MDARSARDIGAQLRGARCARRLTQAEVGKACGYSASAISRIEAGSMQIDHDRLLQIAAFLGLPPDRLIMTPGLHTNVLDSLGRPGEEEDAVRRRNLFTTALAAGATTMVGANRGEAAARIDPAVGLEDILFRLPSAPSAPLPQLMQEMTAARAHYTAARYTALGGAVPGLLASASATRDASSGLAREKANLILARAYVLAAELALKQHSDAAWVAADRALAASRESGRPVPIGEASRVLAITMRRSGRCPAAVRLLHRQADDLDARQHQTGAVRTTLMLTAAYTAATGGDRSRALDLLGEAEEAVERQRATPAGLFTVDATRTQVDVYRIGVFNALGAPDEGVDVTRRLDIDTMSTAERRARAWTDTARMWHALGESGKTFAALRHVEHEAPQEVRRPALRALTADLLYAPARVPGIREFADRTGATPR
jgi:transcriptional regulator with XRE-family HTH domain